MNASLAAMAPRNASVTGPAPPRFTGSPLRATTSMPLSTITSSPERVWPATMKSPAPLALTVCTLVHESGEPGKIAWPVTAMAVPFWAAKPRPNSDSPRMYHWSSPPISTAKIDAMPDCRPGTGSPSRSAMLPVRITASSVARSGAMSASTIHGVGPVPVVNVLPDSATKLS